MSSIVSDGEDLTWKKVRKVTIELLGMNSDRSWGEFKSSAAERLGIPVEALKEWKTEMKELISKGLGSARSHDEDDGNEDEVSEESGSDEGVEYTGSMGSNDRGNKGANEDSDAMKAYKHMCKAMNLGPSPFKGLKQMTPEDAESVLRERLIDAGAKFKGRFPSATEIARAQRETDKAKDLEGIDIDNVIQGSRRRGRPDIVPLPSKRQCNPDGQHSEGSGGDDSEVEFDL